MYYLIESSDGQHVITLRCDTENCNAAEKADVERQILKDAKEEFALAGIGSLGSKLKRFKTERGLNAHIARGQNPKQMTGYVEGERESRETSD